MKQPNVYLVGAGPGDPSLLTLAAVKCLGRADCVIYDGLVDPAVLQYARPDAEKICVRKRTGPNPATQEQINKLLLEKARSCDCVVRLKGGDPLLFARAAEELQTLTDAGISFEIIPGITAAQAAAAYCGILLTDRLINSQILFVTGKESPDKTESAIDWQLLARFEGSLVFYMAMGTLEEIAEKLLGCGKAADTPVAIIADATLPTQRLLKSTLAAVANDCKAARLAAPAIIIIGKAADSSPHFDWFGNRSLFGRRIGITRDPRGNEKFAQMLRDFAACPVPFDCLQIHDLSGSSELTSVLDRVENFDWVVFTSARGVEYTFKAVERLGRDARIFGKTKLACVGSATAEALARFGLAADLVPRQFTTAALAEALIRRLDSKDKNILLLRSAIAPDDLPGSLIKAGTNVVQIPIYTVLPAAPSEEQKEAFGKELERGLDWLTFTSASAVRFFFEQFPPRLVKSSPAKIASIGPAASAQLKALGLDVHIQARPHTLVGLIDSLVQYYDQSGPENIND